MTEPPFAPDRILAVLRDHGVEFVVIGGLAALAHGSPFPTRDIDITPDTSDENLTRLSAALTQLDARIWAGPGEVPLPFRHDATSLAAVGEWNLLTPFGRIDLSLVPNGTSGYADLVREATDVDIVGVVAPVASLADVIRSKQAANRPKDQRVLPTLREILAERHRRTSAPGDA